MSGRDVAVRQFENFVVARHKALLRLGYLLTGNNEDASDLVQSALLKTYARLTRIDQRAMESYVRKVMVNECIRAGGRHRAFDRLRCRLAGRAEVPDAPRAVDARLSLWPLVKSLPARQRAVLVLKYYEDLSDEDIAAILQCSTGTVKTHASRGRQALRASLDGSHQGQESRTEFPRAH